MGQCGLSLYSSPTDDIVVGVRTNADGSDAAPVTPSLHAGFGGGGGGGGGGGSSDGEGEGGVVVTWSTPMSIDKGVGKADGIFTLKKASIYFWIYTAQVSHFQRHVTEFECSRFM